MNAQQQWLFRLGVLCELVRQAPTTLGRTALMKLVYLLQTVKGVPLGYDFRLFTYGPFDSDVLDDLSQAETLGAVKSKMVEFQSGYGYEFTPGPALEEVRQKAEKELKKYREEFLWALREFGGESATDLELIATIVFTDREAARQRQRMLFEELCLKVREVKPRFGADYIAKRIETLAEHGLFAASERKPPRSPSAKSTKPTR